jgi:hypothetical protein
MRKNMLASQTIGMASKPRRPETTTKRASRQPRIIRRLGGFKLVSVLGGW